mgnify:CR=1 FL=1
MSNTVMPYLATVKGCPINSIIGIVQFFKQKKYDVDTINEMIVQAIGIDVSGVKMPLSQRTYLFLYIIQTGWHSDKKGLNLSDQQVLDQATTANNALFAQSYIQSAISIEMDERRKSMSKGELAYEIYCDNVAELSRNDLLSLLEKELETSRPGATTYYYQAKKKAEGV